MLRLLCLVALTLTACRASASPGAPGGSDSSGPAETTSGEAPAGSEIDTGTGAATGESSTETGTEVVPDPHFVLSNARLPGGAAVAVEIKDGFVVEITETARNDEPRIDLPQIDLQGATIVPGFIDSHVHLAFHYGPAGIAAGFTSLRARGVVGAVDLAAPLGTLPTYDGVQWLVAGPMLTAFGGYPTQSWGSQGYGLELRGAVAATASVDRLAAAGAHLVKVPLGAGPGLTDLELDAVVTRAHDRGLVVVAHALGDGDAARAAQFDVDVLAHTPVEPLSEATVAMWGNRAVVSTLAAFGGTAVAVDNLRRLRDAGTIVLYGTDLGNSQVAGIDPRELALLGEAGLSPEEVVAAGTRSAALFWGMATLGELAPGRAATLLVVDGDPLEQPGVIAEPTAVFVDGQMLAPG